MSKAFFLALVMAGLLGSQAFAAEALGHKVAIQGSESGAAPCAGCHGEDGMGNAGAGFPKLAGLNQTYIAKQLHDFRSGARNNPLMQGMAAVLTEKEIAAVSEYMFNLKPKSKPVEADQALVKQGEEIATRGLWDKEIPACSRCHGVSGNGIGTDFPALAGQHANYIESQIAAWKSGDRTNDPNDLMKSVAMRLNEQEAKAVAAYYSQLPAGNIAK